MLGNFRFVCLIPLSFFFLVQRYSSVNDWYNIISGKVWLLSRNLWTAQMFQEFPLNMLSCFKIFCSRQPYLCGTELIILDFGANSRCVLAKHLHLYRILLFLFSIEIL
jgi:hypothetical protein